MTPKNIQSPEEIFSQCNEIHKILTQEVHTDDIEVAIERGHILNTWNANTGKMYADAKYWRDKAMKENILSRMRDLKGVMNLPASTLNELIKADIQDANYLVNWVDRLDRECVHQMEFLRTCISKEKAQMSMLTFGGGGR